MRTLLDPLDEITDTVDECGRPLVEIFSTELTAPVGLSLLRFFRTVDTAAERLAGLMPAGRGGYRVCVRVEPAMRLVLAVSPDHAAGPSSNALSGNRATADASTVQGARAAAHAIQKKFGPALSRAVEAAQHARDAPGVTYESTMSRLGSRAGDPYPHQLFAQVCKPPLTVLAGKDEFVVGGVARVPKAFKTSDGRHAVLGCRIVAASLVRRQVTVMRNDESDLAGSRDHNVLENAPVQSERDGLMTLLAIAMSFDLLVDIEVVKRKRVTGTFRGQRTRVLREHDNKSGPARRGRVCGPELEALDTDEEYVIRDILNVDTLRRFHELAEQLKR